MGQQHNDRDAERAERIRRIAKFIHDEASKLEPHALTGFSGTTSLQISWKQGGIVGHRIIVDQAFHGGPTPA